MAESERVRTSMHYSEADKLTFVVFNQYLPLLIDKVEKICEESGLRNDSIVMRMTGCPNGCARPYVAGAHAVNFDLIWNSSILGQRSPSLEKHPVHIRCCWVAVITVKG
jgi:hypothetical protein